MADFEQHIGELTGQLRGLVPALERLEDRQSIADMKAAALEANHNSLRKEFDGIRDKSSDRQGTVFSKLDNLILDSSLRKSEIAALNVEVSALKAKNEGFGKKAWDLFLILAAACIGAALTKMF